MDYQYTEEHFPQLKLVATELLRIFFGMEIQRVQDNYASFTHPCYYNTCLSKSNPMGEGKRDGTHYISYIYQPK